MEKYDISGLNEEQKRALFDTEGVVLVTAGAGSGKTRLLTHRICHLILDKHISPYNILAITFTNKATNEMKTRVEEMCSGDIWISTFHSMCVKILRREIDVFSGYNQNFTIITETDRDRIIKDICKEQNVEEDEVSKITKHLDNIKNKGLDVEEYFNSVMEFGNRVNLTIYARIINMYNERLRTNNCLDFDDLLNKTYLLFKNYPKILNKYAERFRYVLVDEFQDTNLVQYRLIKLLTSVWGNLFVVGDEDQCIYSWRGANFKNIFDLKNDYQDVKIYKLERNYRSSKNILNIANNVISNNTERLDKSLWTEKDNGAPPVVYEAFDERDEAMFIAREIENLVCQGYSYSDFAILMRLNALSRPIEEGLLSFEIPYKLYGGQKFYERAEIKILLAYLSIFVNPNDGISLEKVINFPKRGIGDVAIKNLNQEAQQSGYFSLLSYMLSNKFEFSKYYSKLETFVKAYVKNKEVLDKISLSEFVKGVVKDFGIGIAYAGKDEESVNRQTNIDSFIVSIEEYEKDNENATLEDYLAMVVLRSDQDDIEGDGFVAVSTIHAVKGLEFKVVFVVALEEGVFPLKRAMDSRSELEEERRLMYVAVTRAEEKIYLTHVSKRYIYGKSNYQSESRFLKELNIVDERTPALRKVAIPERKKDDFFLDDKDEIFESDYKVGERVFHQRFGEGKIIEISPDGFVGKIDFDDVGVKELMLNVAKLERVKDDE